MVFSMKFLMDFFLQGIKLHIHQLLQIFLILQVVMTVSLFMIQVKQLLKLLLRTMSSLPSSQVQIIIAPKCQISVSMRTRFFLTSLNLNLVPSCKRWLADISLDVSEIKGTGYDSCSVCSLLCILKPWWLKFNFINSILYIYFLLVPNTWLLLFLILKTQQIKILSFSSPMNI